MFRKRRHRELKFVYYMHCDTFRRLMIHSSIAFGFFADSLSFLLSSLFNCFFILASCPFVNDYSKFFFSLISSEGLLCNKIQHKQLILIFGQAIFLMNSEWNDLNCPIRFHLHQLTLSSELRFNVTTRAWDELFFSHKFHLNGSLIITIRRGKKHKDRHELSISKLWAQVQEAIARTLFVINIKALNLFEYTNCGFVRTSLTINILATYYECVNQSMTWLQKRNYLSHPQLCKRFKKHKMQMSSGLRSSLMKSVNKLHRSQ